jgi:transposase
LGVKVFTHFGHATQLFICASSFQEAQMNIRYRVELSQAERIKLTTLLSGGKHAARKLKRAQILLADAGTSDDEIARTVAVGGSTVYRTKQRIIEGNLQRALSEDPRPGAERKLTSKQEALRVATACANPPKGRARWTLELLADEMVKLPDHQSLSRETVRRRTRFTPWRIPVMLCRCSIWMRICSAPVSPRSRPRSPARSWLSTARASF